MISDNFWKILFLLMVGTGLAFWYKDFNEKKEFRTAASELADLISFTEETMPRDDAEAQKRFIKALTLVHQANEAGMDRGLLFDAAFDYNEIGIDSAHASLIRNAIYESEEIGIELGIFNEETIWDLLDGQTAKITKGPFAGENFALTHRLPPSIGEDARLFLGNLLVVPNSVEAITRDLVITEDLHETTIRLANAGILKPETSAAIRKSFYLQRESNRY